MLPRLRSSSRLLRKLCGLETASPAPAPAAAAAAAAARRISPADDPSSLGHPLPGLDLPPCLPDNLDRSPTRITTLPNGIRIATEDVPGPSACIGFFVDSGSVYESAETTGVSHLLEKMAFKDTMYRTHRNIISELELAGGNVGATCSREQMVYSYDTLKAYMPEAIEILIDCVRNPLFLPEEVERQLALAREEVQDLQKNPEKFIHEHLNLVGFSGALANPLIAPEDALARINDKIIKKFYHVFVVVYNLWQYVLTVTVDGRVLQPFDDNENFTADRVVLAASGVDHEHLLGYADFLLNDWHKRSSVEKPKSTYVGGDSRHRADSDMTHVALAFEVPGGWLQERDATIVTVIQTLMGGGGSFSSGGPGKGMHSRLYLRVLNEYHSVQNFSAFSNVYDNSGLFGIYLTTPSGFVSKAVDIAIREMIAVATPGEVTEVELQRAKNSTISSGLMNLESRVIVAEDIGRQLLTYGCRKPIDSFLQCMEEITLDDIAAFARKMLSSKPTLVSWGNVDKVPRYEFVCKRLR